ncbi:ATP-binding cassette domain-containing protein [Carboxydochorda subterranea]|uniref:ATP-binding cassette domain-containing protein n=1 Tax=Carboxydichorda subterranea TaxID=3109565 RepID=A0ABZ1BWB2_9FIRM|nr:ATP-binding cassette domain-containing protein [Limnochorda sp. L945t]WRP16905.1 ATP-binding cassette domain-containing protein [Limnochorda sp. L945t]
MAHLAGRTGKARARAGLWRHFVTWILAAALLAGAGSTAVSWGMQRALATTVELALGEAGRWDVLVQVQEDRLGEARGAIQQLAASRYPGARVRTGPTAAGSAVVLLSLPPSMRTGPSFERLGRELQGIPGVVAWVPLVEPSIVVSRLHPAIAARVQDQAERDRGVAYTFFHGSDLVLVLRRPEELSRVRARLDEWLGGYRVIRVSPQVPAGSPAPGQSGLGRLAQDVSAAVSAMPGRPKVAYAGPVAEGSGAAAVRWAGRMRDFLLQYATVARIEPRQDLSPPLAGGEEVEVGRLAARVLPGPSGSPVAVLLDDPASSVDLLGKTVEVRRHSGQLVGTAVVDGGRLRIEAALQATESLVRRVQELGSGASSALDAADGASREVAQALDRLQEAASQLDRAAWGADPVEGTLVALVLNALLESPGARPQSSPPGSPGIADLQGRIARLRQQVDALRQADLPHLLDHVRTLRQELPALSGREVASALALLEQSGDVAAAGGSGVELVVEGAPGAMVPEAVQRALAARPGLGPMRAWVSPAGTASPSPRALVLQLVERASKVAAALAAALLVAWSLVNDWAVWTSVHLAARRGSDRRALARARRRMALAGAGSGLVMGTLAGAMAFWGQEGAWIGAVSCAGALAGLAAGWWHERLAPVDGDAVEAARAAGLSLPAVLEYVVAPESRPWVLAWTASRRPPRSAPAAVAQAASRPGRGQPAPAGEGTSAPALEAVGLVKRFESHRALDGVSLSLGRGETVVVMGPSGCGKSTLLRCLKGLVEPDEGRVLMDGQDLHRMAPGPRQAMRRRVGLVFQRPQLVSHLPVLDNVALAATAAGLPWEQAREAAWHWLKALDMQAAAGRLPSQLSGGEGQRAAIARALVTDPEVVLWDEPTSQLDPLLVAELLGLMEELIRRLRTTMLVVTHEPRFALRVGQRLVLMEAGRIVEEGEPRRVLSEPASPVGRRLAELVAI